MPRSGSPEGGGQDARNNPPPSSIVCCPGFVMTRLRAKATGMEAG